MKCCKICADGCILYRDALHAPTSSYPLLNICDSGPWYPALRKYWQSVPMDVFRTEKYYTHLSILHFFFLLIKVVKWSRKSSYLLVKITKLCVQWILFIHKNKMRHPPLLSAAPCQIFYHNYEDPSKSHARRIPTKPVKSISHALLFSNIWINRH